MSQARPKQRVLVRWNDDLDKSLLLFITHTCTDLGIKIPYEEVARRMGSTFTEGAIQQHIAKLRNKMAELNVAPVPGPPRRGAVTNRPSGVYTQKTRTGPPPPPPASAATRRRSTTVAQSLLGEEQEQGNGARRTGSKRKGRTTQIKRSESDVGESDGEFEDAEDAQYTNSGSNKRKRGGRGNGGQSRARKVRKSTPDPNNDPMVTAIMQRLQEADCEFDAQAAAMGGDVEHDDVEHSVGNIDGPAMHPRGPQFEYSQYAPAGQGHAEDEEEENLVAGRSNTEFLPQFDMSTHALYAQDGQVSPTSQMPQSMPYQQFDGHAQQRFMYNFSQPLTKNSGYASTPQDNIDFGNWQPGFALSSYSHNAMPPPQSPWPGTIGGMNSHQNSISSTRNPSTTSNFSAQGRGDGMAPPQTPTSTGFGAQTLPDIAQPSPQGVAGLSQNSFNSPEHQGYDSALFVNQDNSTANAASSGYDFSDETLFGGQFDFGDQV